MDPMEEAQVSLAAEGDVWTLTLPEMGMGTMSMESISVEVELAESADGYTLSAESIEAVSGETSITGSLTGTVSADGSTMTLSAECHAYGHQCGFRRNEINEKNPKAIIDNVAGGSGHAVAPLVQRSFRGHL